jgi:hypothetical protein
MTREANSNPALRPAAIGVDGPAPNHEGHHTVTVRRRNLFGPPNQYDDGLKAASYVDGCDDSLSARQNYTAPLSVTDTSSDETRAEREGLENAFKAAQRASSSATDDGTGRAIG